MGAMVRDLRYVSKSRCCIFIEGEYSKESSAAMREFQSIVHEAAMPNDNVCRQRTILGIHQFKSYVLLSLQDPLSRIRIGAHINTRTRLMHSP
jgi:hypothetical protein